MQAKIYKDKTLLETHTLTSKHPKGQAGELFDEHVFHKNGNLKSKAMAEYTDYPNGDWSVTKGSYEMVVSH